MSTTVLPPRARRRVDDVDAGVDETTIEGWCITTRPWQCDCGRIGLHVTFDHEIIVWPEKDDEHLLKVAIAAKRLRRDPRVAEYEPEMGPAVTIEDVLTRYPSPQVTPSVIAACS